MLPLLLTDILHHPGIMSGIFLTLVARKCKDEAMLPLSMVAIPVVFYTILFVKGWSIADAREGGWVGEVRYSILLVFPVCEVSHDLTFSCSW